MTATASESTRDEIAPKPASAPRQLRVGALLAAATAVTLVAAAVVLAADVWPAHHFRAAAETRANGGVGDLVVGIVLNLLGAAAMVVGALRIFENQRSARPYLLSGAWTCIGTAVFWLLLDTTRPVLIWAGIFAALGLCVLVVTLLRASATWFGPDVTAPSRRVVGVRDRWNGLARSQQWGLSLVGVAVVVILPFISSSFPLFGLVSTEPGFDFPIALFNASYYALIAVGLNVVIGQAGLLDLGYVGFFAIGAYVVSLLTSSDSTVRVFTTTPWAWIVCVPIAMAITMFSGLILGAPTLRLRGDYLAIVTLGFAEIVRLVADNVTPLRGQVGFQNIAAPPGHSGGSPIFTQTDGKPWYWMTVGLIVVVLLLVGNLERSRVGRAWVAIREDEDAAEIMGVPTFKFKLWAFVMGAAIGGLSGTLFAGQIGFVNNQKFDPVTSILFVAAVVLGGAGNKVGVMLGAFLISYIPERFTELEKYKFLIFGVALITLMLFRPQGLLGARQRLLTYGRVAYRRIAGRPEQLDTGAGAFSTDASSGAMGAGMVEP